MTWIDRRIHARRRPDTPADVAWRTAYQEVLAQVRLERESHPPITADTVEAELEWQAARITTLMRARGFAA